uniref:conserved phage C-terminal domain-containing protein n=1 Tax=Rahnella sp. NRRL B-41462 TaxID=1610579 RepID=UPI0018E53C99
KQDPSDNKTSCQPAAQTDAEVEITDQAKQVLKHLNQITGSRYQPTNSSLENMRARLREGHTLEELQLVIEYKQVHWGDSPKMAEYLRPATLFQPAKFEGYLLSATKWAKSGRPVCVNGKWTAEGGVEVDAAERDAAYRRFISGVAATKAPSALEKMVCTEASKASVRSMRADFAITTWAKIWKECAQRQQGVKA